MLTILTTYKMAKPLLAIKLKPNVSPPAPAPAPASTPPASASGSTIIEDKYKKLEHLEHVLLKPEIYVGSIRTGRGRDVYL